MSHESINIDFSEFDMCDEIELRDKKDIIEYLDHSADLQIFCRSPNINKLFVASAKAMINYCTDLKEINEKYNKFRNATKNINKNKENFVMDSYENYKTFEYRDSLKGSNKLGFTLVEFLQNFLEIIYGDGYVPFKFLVETNKNELVCRFLGCRIQKCKMKGEIKAVTLSKLKVEHVNNEYECFFIVDI